jgi:hypothetical protein
MVVCNGYRPIEQGHSLNAHGEAFPYQNCWAARSGSRPHGSGLVVAPVSRHSRVSAMFKEGAFREERISRLYPGIERWPQAWITHDCSQTHATKQKTCWSRASSRRTKAQQPKTRETAKSKTENLVESLPQISVQPKNITGRVQHHEANHRPIKVVGRKSERLSCFPLQNISTGPSYDFPSSQTHTHIPQRQTD